jgi:single-stranded DNA-binding protein
MDIRIVDGRLTRDAEVRVNKTNNKKFLTFTIANNGFAKGEQTTTYFNVVSYNEFDVNRLETLTKGKLVVVTGKPNEVMTIRDNKTYLNRNIMAHNIEMGTFAKETTTQVTSYPDVAPLPTASPNITVAAPVPTCEVPQVPQPTVAAPTVATPTVTPTPMPAMPQVPNVATSVASGPYEVHAQINIPDVTDELPF